MKTRLAAALALGALASGCATERARCPPSSAPTLAIAPAPSPPKAAAAPAEPASEPQPELEIHEWNLAIGETVVLREPSVKSYRDPSAVADTRVAPDAKDTFVVTGKAVGEGDLVLLRHDGTSRTLHFVVTKAPMRFVAAHVRSLLVGLPGVYVRVVGTRIVIDGSARDDAELDRVQRVAAIYPDQAVSLVAPALPRPGRAAAR